MSKSKERTTEGKENSEQEGPPIDVKPDRTRENRLKRWLLVSGDRRIVTLVLLFGVFLALTLAGKMWPLQMRDMLQETNTVQMLFNTLLSGIILLVSIVVSINSVVLSQELGSLGTQHERIENSLEYRRDLEQFAQQDVSPTEPAQFIKFILETIDVHADRLRESIADTADADLREQVETYVENVDDEIQVVSDHLDQTYLEQPNILLAGLSYDYAGQIYLARRLVSQYDDVLDDAQHEAFDEFIRTLNYFASGREYFKTLFYKKEMASLSSVLLYVSLPSILFTSYVLLALNENLFPEVSLFGLPLLLLYISLAFTVALAPYLVLTSYVVRTAAVAKRSLDTGPFMLTQNGSSPSMEWEE